MAFITNDSNETFHMKDEMNTSECQKNDVNEFEFSCPKDFHGSFISNKIAKSNMMPIDNDTFLFNENYADNPTETFETKAEIMDSEDMSDFHQNFNHDYISEDSKDTSGPSFPIKEEACSGITPVSKLISDQETDFTTCTLPSCSDNQGAIPFCPLCYQSFPSFGNLTEHIRNCNFNATEKDKNLFKCSQCDRALPDANSLAAHMLLHEGRRVYECQICDKTFKQSRSLRYHTNTHTGDRPYECSICSKAFREKGSLRRHIKTHSQERPFKCELCEQNFKQAIHLRRHMERHLKVKTEHLPHLSESTPQNNVPRLLEEDVLLSNDIRLSHRPYKCSKCTQTFALQINKLEHQRTVHENPSKLTVKPRVKSIPECSHCGKFFTTSRGLKYHMNIHTGARPYKCVECNKTFRDKASRRRHMRCHNGFHSGHQCLLCPSAFASAVAWRDHMVKRHSVLDILNSSLPPLSSMPQFTVPTSNAPIAVSGETPSDEFPKEGAVDCTIHLPSTSSSSLSKDLLDTGLPLDANRFNCVNVMNLQ